MSSRLEDLQYLTRLATQRLVDEWSRLGDTTRPWGTWVLLWDTIGNDEELETWQPTVPLKAAWFLTGSGYTRRESWSYLRILGVRRMEREQQWFSRSPEFGVLQVAPYRDRLAVYGSAQFGPRFGRGFRLELDTERELRAHDLWVS